jgi:hypothetical protein
LLKAAGGNDSTNTVPAQYHTHTQKMSQVPPKKRWKKFILKMKPGVVAYACNPSYMGGTDQEDHG